MREITASSYLTRRSEVSKINRKFFFPYEGKETEKNYLNALLEAFPQNKYTACFCTKIKSNHVGKIVERAVDIYEGKTKLKYDHYLLIKAIKIALDSFDIVYDEKLIEDKVIDVAKETNKSLDDVFNKKEIEKIIILLKNELEDINIINLNNLNEIIENIGSFDPELDLFIIIGDRDKGNFKENQFDNVLEISKMNFVKVIISAPCIELWFYLHFDDVDSLNADILNSGQGSKYIYKELINNKDKDYKKNAPKEYFIAHYLPNTAKAITNSLKYETKIVNLKDNIGTNFKDLIELLNLTLVFYPKIRCSITQHLEYF